MNRTLNNRIIQRVMEIKRISCSMSQNAGCVRLTMLEGMFHYNPYDHTAKHKKNQKKAR